MFMVTINATELSVVRHSGNVYSKPVSTIHTVYVIVAVLQKSEAMGFGPVTSVVMFTDEPDVPIPEYLLPLYGELQLLVAAELILTAV